MRHGKQNKSSTPQSTPTPVAATPEPLLSEVTTSSLGPNEAEAVESVEFNAFTHTSRLTEESRISGKLHHRRCPWCWERQKGIGDIYNTYKPKNHRCEETGDELRTRYYRCDRCSRTFSIPVRYATLLLENRVVLIIDK